MHAKDTLTNADRVVMRWVIWGVHTPLVVFIGSGVFWV